MNKKLIFPLVCLSAIGFMACSSDDDSADNSLSPQPTSSYVEPVVTSSQTPYVDPNAGAPVEPASSAAQTIDPGTPSTVPQTGSYANLASAVNTAKAASLFASWKAAHFTTLENEKVVYASVASEFDDIFTASYLPAGRVIWSTAPTNYRGQCSVDDATVSNMKMRACSVSEGIGYGMLLAYFQNDAEMFNRLWNYTRAFREYNGGNLMPWLEKSFTYHIADESSATDADLDIATSLILMYYKYQQSAYLDDALLIIKELWDTEIEPNSLRILSGNTSMWNGKNGMDFTYNLSYFSPVAIRLFAEVDKSHNWKGVLDAMYTYMATVQAGGTGVFPDWSNSQGVAVNPPNKSAGMTEKAYTWYTFNKEAVRIPWRIAWDYYWYQEPRAQAVLKTLNDFIVAKSGGNPDSDALSTNYSWDLSLGADKTSSVVAKHWYAAWCATGIGTNANWLNACTAGVNAKDLTNNASSYFADILLVMYGQLLNGMFVKPF